MFGKKKGNVLDQAYGVMLGDQLSFAAAEAYKLLRTNLMFALTEDDEQLPCGWRHQLRPGRGEVHHHPEPGLLPCGGG